MEELITAREAAKLKGVTTDTVYKAIREGKLAAVQVLDKTGIPRAALEVWEPSTRGGKRPGAGRKKQEAAE